MVSLANRRYGDRRRVFSWKVAKTVRHSAEQLLVKMILLSWMKWPDTIIPPTKEPGCQSCEGRPVYDSDGK
jgi:hypothetical protein